MNILFLDASSRTGYCIFSFINETAVLKQYGVIQLNNQKQDFERITELEGVLVDIVKEHRINYVVFEDIAGERYRALIFLAKLQYFLQAFCFYRSIDFDFKGIIATKWRSCPNGVGKLVKKKGRVTKEEWQQYITKLMNEPSIDHNESDVLGIAIYFFIKKSTLPFSKIKFDVGKRLHYKISKKRTNQYTNTSSL